jgi:hypothetical protein
MDPAALMLAAALVVGEAELTKCVAKVQVEVSTIRAGGMPAAGAAVRGRMATGVRYLPGITINERPFRRCRAYACLLWTKGHAGNAAVRTFTSLLLPKSTFPPS